MPMNQNRLKISNILSKNRNHEDLMLLVQRCLSVMPFYISALESVQWFVLPPSQNQFQKEWVTKQFGKPFH